MGVAYLTAIKCEQVYVHEEHFRCHLKTPVPVGRASMHQVSVSGSTRKKKKKPSGISTEAR